MIQRVTIDANPYQALDDGKTWWDRGIWPCHWITVSETLAPPFAAAYRRLFRLEKSATIRAHVTADERYQLFIDGQLAARGSERGDPGHWYFESYDITLPPGEHSLVARVWSLGGLGPWAQMSTHHGFLFAVEGEWIPLLATGASRWEARLLPGVTFTDPMPAIGTGANLLVDGASFAWGFERGEGEGWQPAALLYHGMVPQRAEAADPADRRSLPAIHELTPAALPPMLDRPVDLSHSQVRFVAAYDRLVHMPPDPEKLFNYHPEQGAAEIKDSLPVRAADHLAAEAPAWQSLLQQGAPVSIPPHTHRRVLVDLGNYYCAYPRLTVSAGAGARVTLLWAEGLYQEPAAVSKGQRDEVEGKYFYGVGDIFLPDGGQHRAFDTLWWQAGRYIEIRIETGEAPLTIERLELTETRYPLENQAVFDSSEPRITAAMPILLRGLQMCAHETYMDCPYYEQLMYVGDTRLEALTTYAITTDDRLPRKALEMFAASRAASGMDFGLTQSRYPSHVRQVIPPFSLWYVGMVHDYATWRGDMPFIRRLMPHVRGILDAFLACRDDSGLVACPPGWNFMDWARGWDSGIPPGGDRGANAAINWLAVLALDWAAGLEGWLGEPELSARWNRMAGDLAAACMAFWDPARRRFGDDLNHTCASEHAQALSILSQRLPVETREEAARSLLQDPDLTRATIYMRHYLFEAFRLLGQPDAILERMQLWYDLAPTGLKTTPETPEPTRSDCHGWGAHPLYHSLATLLGIRPDGYGFERVRIAPQPGSLNQISGSLPHPKGNIAVKLWKEGGELKGHVILPGGLEGAFIYGGRQVALGAGKTDI